MKITISAEDMKILAHEWLASRLIGSWKITELDDYGYMGSYRVEVTHVDVGDEYDCGSLFGTPLLESVSPVNDEEVN